MTRNPAAVLVAVLVVVGAVTLACAASRRRHERVWAAVGGASLGVAVVGTLGLLR